MNADKTEARSCFQSVAIGVNPRAAYRVSLQGAKYSVVKELGLGLRKPCGEGGRGHYVRFFDLSIEAVKWFEGDDLALECR
jgi:hypothetical protein